MIAPVRLGPGGRLVVDPFRLWPGGVPGLTRAEMRRLALPCDRKAIANRAALLKKRLAQGGRL